MRWFSRLNTVFYKLVMSYVALIFITILFVGLASYHYFSNIYNEELKKMESKILNHTSQNLLNEIVDIVERSYILVAMGDSQISPAAYLFDQPLNGNHEKIHISQQYLKKIAASYPEVLDSISIYYRSNDIVVSSLSGVTYLDEENASIDLEWLERVHNREDADATIWVEARSVPRNIHSNSHTAKLVTFIRPYPYTIRTGEAKGYIALHIKESMLQKLIHSEKSSEGNMLLIGKDGTILTHNFPEDVSSSLTALPFYRQVTAPDSRDGSFITSVGNTETMVTSVTVPNTEWKLVSATPVSEFYKKTVPLRHTLLTICIAAIAIGIVISNIFTMRIYNPLRPIINKAKSAFDQGKAGHQLDENEFSLLDRVINNLSVKIYDLENTIDSNAPLIKHHFVLGLLHGKIPSKSELEGTMRLIGLQLPYLKHTAVLIRLDGATMSQLTLENRQFIKFNLIKELEQWDKDNTRLLAAELSEYELCAIVNANDDVTKKLERLHKDAKEYVHDNFMMKLTFSAGRPASSLLELEPSCREAAAALKYAPIHPEQSLFFAEVWMPMEERDEEMPAELTARFSSELRSGRLSQVKAVVEEFTHLAQSGAYSADHCWAMWTGLTDAYRSYLEDLPLKGSESQYDEWLKTSVYPVDIISCKSMLIQAIEDTYQNIEALSNQKNRNMVTSAKQYISDNLQQSISLESAAEHVRISGKYLSRLFKEETGLNFSEYVNRKRLELAERYILTSDMTIEQISAHAGFNSSAYFIKKFKETYSVTPRMYKQYYLSEEKRTPKKELAH
ncbi:helix-turn-helix domain-containing protein [Paenibacillus sp. J5C_2022]|uniref:AraC family transcriptional regulator n=1 Tax=Paenibacillus sp. J5C2022 TaxID=2977129 RepID=UPI0021D3B0B7|nr:AraC family transcriptional regulator [Paenibacillus sp. J5C2022]MCU6708633.1 helix-turn-helix domain-containing protein [Paenibacillus sp. J5C2022]